MVTAAEHELEKAGVTETPEVVVADPGYWHQVQMESVVARGIEVMIPLDARKRGGARPGWDGGLYAFMRRVVATEIGGALYRKRQGMIEPVFGQVRFNRNIDRFQRRGRSAVRSEWRFIVATTTCLSSTTTRSQSPRPERGVPAAAPPSTATKSMSPVAGAPLTAGFPDSHRAKRDRRRVRREVRQHESGPGRDDRSPGIGVTRSGAAE